MSSARKLVRAFTLIELLVVVAIIALLIAILMPTLMRARDQAKKAVCLAHLRDIGSAAHQYATEDETDRLMPMSPAMVQHHRKVYRTCPMWFSWGGRAAPQVFQSAGGELLLNHLNTEVPYYRTRQRPLTVYLYPDIEDEFADLPIFECPGDRGYPEFPPEIFTDAPVENAGNRLYDTVGNSYRGSLFHSAYPRKGAVKTFSYGIWGQRIDALENTSQLIWGGDPLFFEMIGSDSPSGWEENKLTGWHGEFQADNELYADGHAASTTAVGKDDEKWNPTPQEYDAWGLDPQFGKMICRGPGYQIDCYPVPGVAICGYPVGGRDTTRWPWRGYSTCPAPPD